MRRAWSTRVPSQPCCARSKRPTRSSCSSGTPNNSRPSAPAACSARSSTVSAQSSSTRTVDNATPQSAPRSQQSATGTATTTPTGPPTTSDSSWRRHAIAARTRLLADWWEHAQHDPARNAMVALKRRDAAILNSLGRALMDSNGRLGRERIVAGDREYATGDRIVCLRNNDLLGVQNGTRGTVTAVDRTRGVLTIASDSGTVVTLSARYLADGHLSYGYALTGHSAQGATFERAYVLGRSRPSTQRMGLRRAQPSRDEHPPLHRGRTFPAHRRHRARHP